MNISRSVLMGVVGTIIALAVINRVAFLAPVSGVVKTITG